MPYEFHNDYVPLPTGEMELDFHPPVALPALQMVELASEKFVCIVDDTKLVEGIGGSKGGVLPSPE